MKIHIFGASGSGVTTLGNALADELGYPYFDNDSYFWETTDPPFTVKRDPAKRNALLLHDLSRTENWVLGGSMVSWGDEWTALFDAAVFLFLPADIRLERLRKRELQRYGDVILTDPERNPQYEAFINWASGYDNNTTISSSGSRLGRTLKVHRDWIEILPCPVLEITGNHTVKERVQLVLDFVDE